MTYQQIKRVIELWYEMFKIGNDWCLIYSTEMVSKDNALETGVGIVAHDLVKAYDRLRTTQNFLILCINDLTTSLRSFWILFKSFLLLVRVGSGF